MSRLEFLRGDAPNDSARTGATVVGLIALVMVIAIGGGVPFLSGSGRIVRAEFTSANQVNSATPVRVAGVEVGRVEAVEPGGSERTATVVMRITDDDVVVRRDARADVRWRTILGGNMFIDLRPGSPSAPELGDGTIPAARTTSQSELDDLTQTFDGGTAQAQRRTLLGLRDGFADPRATGRAIETAGPALRDVGAGLGALRGSESADLRRLVAATARTVGGLGRDTRLLEQLVSGAERTLAVTAARRRALGELIAVAPPSLDSTLATMDRLRTTLDHLDPVVVRLRRAAPGIAPAADAAAPTLREARMLLRAAQPLVRDASPAFTALRRASATGVPVVRGLDPTVRRLNEKTLPLLERRDEGTQLRTYEAIGPFFSVLSTVAATFNDAGHQLQFAVAPGPNSVLSINAPPALRKCRARVPVRARSRCDDAARVLARMFGGRR